MTAIDQVILAHNPSDLTSHGDGSYCLPRCPAWVAAEDSHSRYERIAAGVGYETKPESRTEFKDVPEKNRVTMLRTYQEQLVSGVISMPSLAPRSNYIGVVVDELQARFPQLGSLVAAQYALLVLTTGEATTNEHVHDAWGIATHLTRMNNKSLVPFEDLDEATQGRDSKYTDAIREMAAARRCAALAAPLQP